MSPGIGHNGLPDEPPGHHAHRSPFSAARDTDESGLECAGQALETPVKACPINVPPKLLRAFRKLGADPVLSGGMAVQVWTGTGFAPGFLQAAEVAIMQAQTPCWDDEWIDQSAQKAGLGKLWNHLKIELEGGHPTPAGLEKALKLGWG